MKKKFFFWLITLILINPVKAQFTYTLITNGLTDQYESGRTKFKMGDIDGDGDIDIISVGDQHESFDIK
jgi:hypothetical protein